MVFYSHFWDLLLKLASLFGIVALLVAVHTAEWVQTMGVPPDYAVPITVAIGTVLWIAGYRQGLSTIASWLYATVSLGVGVSLTDARRLTRLFQLDLSLKWVPLKELRRLPETERKGALFAALERLLPVRKAMLF